MGEMKMMGMIDMFFFGYPLPLFVYYFFFLYIRDLNWTSSGERWFHYIVSSTSNNQKNKIGNEYNVKQPKGIRWAATGVIVSTF